VTDINNRINPEVEVEPPIKEAYIIWEWHGRCDGEVKTLTTFTARPFTSTLTHFNTHLRVLLGDFVNNRIVAYTKHASFN
jgi:hypothetical protein